MSVVLGRGESATLAAAGSCAWFIAFVLTLAAVAAAAIFRESARRQSNQR